MFMLKSLFFQTHLTCPPWKTLNIHVIYKDQIHIVVEKVTVQGLIKIFPAIMYQPFMLYGGSILKCKFAYIFAVSWVSFVELQACS